MTHALQTRLVNWVPRSHVFVRNAHLRRFSGLVLAADSMN
jgi:hypothetical protein